MRLFRHTPPTSNGTPAGTTLTSRRCGVSAVEFAVLAPILFMLVMGFIEFGRAMMATNLLTNVAREGARVAVIPTSSNTEVSSTVSDNMSSLGMPTTNMCLTVDVNGTTANCNTATSGDKVGVTVTVPYQDVAWLPTSWFLGDATLRGKAVMRRE